MFYLHLALGISIFFTSFWAIWMTLQRHRQQTQLASFGEALADAMGGMVEGRKKGGAVNAEALLVGARLLQQKSQQASSLLRWMELDLEPPKKPALELSQRTHTEQALKQLFLESQATSVLLVDDQGAPLDFVGDFDESAEGAVFGSLLHRIWGAFEHFLDGPVRVVTLEMGGRGLHLVKLENSPLYLLIEAGIEVPWMALGRAALRLGGELWEREIAAWSLYPREKDGVTALPLRMKSNALIGTHALSMQSKVTAWLQRYPVEQASVYDVDGVLLLGTNTKGVVNKLQMMPIIRCLAQRVWNAQIELETFSLRVQGFKENTLFIRPLGNEPYSPLAFVEAPSKEQRSVEALLSALRWHFDAQPVSLHLAR
jgi:hypothetical protein